MENLIVLVVALFGLISVLRIAAQKDAEAGRENKFTYKHLLFYAGLLIIPILVVFGIILLVACIHANFFMPKIH